MHTRLKVALALTLMLLMVPMAHAADRTVLLYPTMLAKRMITGEYEWAVGADNSRVMQLSIGSETSPDVKAAAMSGSYGMHQYLNGKAMDGLYVGGTVTVLVASAVDTATLNSTASLIVGADGRVGYKYRFADSFMADGGLRAAFPLYATAEAPTNSASAFGAEWFGLGLRIGVGYTW